MADRVSKKVRSAIMASVKSKNTKPELIVRRALHKLGYRYRLHRKDLPGSPDLVFPSRRAVIFVHGCFWHGHGCRWGRLPKSRMDYWQPKIAANKKRDSKKLHSIRRRGWRSMVLWSCELRNEPKALKKATTFLGPSSSR